MEVSEGPSVRANRLDSGKSLRTGRDEDLRHEWVPQFEGDPLTDLVGTVSTKVLREGPSMVPPRTPPDHTGPHRPDARRHRRPYAEIACQYRSAAPVVPPSSAVAAA